MNEVISYQQSKATETVQCFLSLAKSVNRIRSTTLSSVIETLYQLRGIAFE